MKTAPTAQQSPATPWRLSGILLAQALVTLSAFNAYPAELTVVQQGGVSALPYYQSLSIQSGEKAIAPLPPVPVVSQADESQMLPVVSKTLSPGKVQAKTLSAAGLTQPVFLVGSDPLSLAWLAQRGAVLRELGAVGLAVEVPDAKALASIRHAASGLSVLPIPGDDIGALLGISHYPLLLTQTGLEQ